MTDSTERRGKRRGNRLRIVAWTTAGLLLLLPLIAMRFTDEVAWTGTDFVFAAALMLVVGGALELTVRKTGNSAYRAAVAVALAAAFLLIWVSGAVIIGDETDDANLMYGVCSRSE
jgi:peptidoglycan/LPS O-acetylase OafA/YrhL